MNKPKATDAKQVGRNGQVVLLVGDYDPAHIDYFRAAESLASMDNVEQVWLSPLSSRGRSDHVRNMCTILATDITGSTGKQVACCTVALSKKYLFPDELLAWCCKHYSNLTFRVARIDGLADEHDIAVIFANEEGAAKKASETVFLKQFLRQPNDLKERIKAGRDMSRSFPAPIWEYLQQFMLYRV